MVIFYSTYKQQFTQTETFFTYRSLSYSTGVLLGEVSQFHNHKSTGLICCGGSVYMCTYLAPTN